MTAFFIKMSYIQQQIERVEKDGMQLRFIDKPTPTIIRAAIRQNWKAVIFADEKYHKYAVKINVDAEWLINPKIGNDDLYAEIAQYKPEFAKYISAQPQSEWIVVNKAYKKPMLAKEIHWNERENFIQIDFEPGRPSIKLTGNIIKKARAVYQDGTFDEIRGETPKTLIIRNENFVLELYKIVKFIGLEIPYFCIHGAPIGQLTLY